MVRDNTQSIHFPGDRYDHVESTKEVERQHRSSQKPQKEYEINETTMTPPFKDFMASKTRHDCNIFCVLHVRTRKVTDILRLISACLEDFLMKRKVFVSQHPIFYMYQISNPHRKNAIRVCCCILVLNVWWFMAMTLTSL